MEPVTLTFTAALLIGLFYGAGPCNIACLPYLGPVFAARPGGIGGAWRTIIPFSAGRLVAYSGIGLAAGTAGRAVTTSLESGAGAWLLGAATIVVGSVILWRTRRTRSACPSEAGTGESRVVFHATPTSPVAMPLGLFGMGLAMALNPCVPLGTVALAAAATADPLAGLTLGAAFGLGAVAIPALLFGLIVAHVGEQVRERFRGWRRGIEQGAGGMLVVLGLLTVSGVLHP